MILSGNDGACLLAGPENRPGINRLDCPDIDNRRVDIFLLQYLGSLYTPFHHDPHLSLIHISFSVKPGHLPSVAVVFCNSPHFYRRGRILIKFRSQKNLDKFLHHLNSKSEGPETSDLRIITFPGALGRIAVRYLRGADSFYLVCRHTCLLYTSFPDDTPKEREHRIAKAKGAVFISQIGKELASGKKHDGRAPDYDDWELNGDIIVYYPVLDIGLELSSMGIRVDEDTLKRQLKLAGCEERASLPFQKALLDGELPYTVGGGIGQSRICMYYLRKAHIGEVQSSIWPDDVAQRALEHGIQLL